MADNAQLIRSPRLYSGVPYAYAATAPADARLVHFAGACPLDADGSTAAIGDYEGQTLRCLENLRVALDDAGAELTDVVFLRVLVASPRRQDLSTAWATVRTAFGDHDAPGTLFGVTVLGWPDQLVEIEAVAAIR